MTDTNVQHDLDEALNLLDEDLTCQLIVESIDDINDGHILARVVGESFFLDKASRNKRFYTASLWTKIVNDPALQQRLADRLVYGTIGHRQPLDDDAIREGKVSHIVSRMWITEDGKGMAEFLVLNTPTGTVLNTLLRAKSKLYTSTRAKGTFLKKFDNSGNQYVNESNFTFETIDFVKDPGFLESRPDLVEAHLNDSNLDKGDITMAEDNQVLGEELKAQRTTISNLQESLTTTQNKLSEALDKARNAEVVSEQLNAYKALGSTQSIQEQLAELAALKASQPAVEESATLLTQYRALGEVTVVKELVESATSFVAEAGAFEEALAHLKQYNAVVAELGTPAEIQEHLTNYQKIVNAGVNNVEEAVALVATMKALGTTDVTEAAGKITALTAFEEEAGPLAEALTVLRSTAEFFENNNPAKLIADSKSLTAFQEEFGPLPEARKALLLTHAYMTQLQNESRAAERKTLAESLGLDEAKVNELMDVRGLDQATITEMFALAKGTTGSKPASPAKVPGVTGSVFLNSQAIEENKNSNTHVPKSRVARLISG